MAGKTLESISDDGPSGGGSAVLNDSKIQSKLQKLWAHHEQKPANANESVEMMKIRNDNIRTTKGIKRRGEHDQG